jgi:hypothetical protein
MNALYTTLNAIAAAQGLPPEFVRQESRVIAREVAADALLSDAAIQRSRMALQQLEREIEALEHYTKHVAGRAPL